MKPFLPLILSLLSLCCAGVAEGGVPPKAERARHEAPIELRDTTLTLAVPVAGDEIETLTIQVSVAVNARPRAGEAKEYWAVTLLPSGLTVTLRGHNSDFGDLLDRHTVRLTISRDGKTLWSGEAEGASPRRGDFNTLRLTLADSLYIAAGNTLAEPVCTLPIPTDLPPTTSVTLSSTGRATLSLFALEAERSPRARLASGWTRESIDAHIASSSDSMEGRWLYLDRQNDPAYARPGGDYLLATLADGHGGYDIVYLGGAAILPVDWEPGMLKGHLAPTQFIDHYTLTWLDSSGEAVDRETSADLTAGGSILALNFPLLKTMLRFARQ